MTPLDTLIAAARKVIDSYWSSRLSTKVTEHMLGLAEAMEAYDKDIAFRTALQGGRKGEV